jgi:endonuclease/exonuclease/phosphatase family metal-dependent hydrolase
MVMMVNNTPPHHHDHSIVSFNPCGINSDHQKLEIEMFLHYTAPMVLILQEPKIDRKKNKSPANFNNYNTMYFPHLTKPTGIVFYVHKSVIARKLDVPHSEPYSKDRNTTCAFLEIILPFLLKPVILAGVYLANGSSNNEVQHMIRQLSLQSRKGYLLAMGDFNSRHASWDSEVSYTTGKEYNHNGKFLHQHIANQALSINSTTLHLLNNIYCKFKPTHVSHKGDSVIDLAFTSSPTLTTGLEVLYDTYISSDHYPIKVSLHVPACPSQEASGRVPGHLVWDIDHADWTLYKSSLDTLLPPWISKYTKWKKHHPNPATTTQRDIDDCWKELHKIISSTASLCIGQRRVTHMSKNWWSHTVLQLSKKFHRLERKYFLLRSRRRNTSPTILASLLLQRNKARNEFRTASRQAKLDASNKSSESIESNKKVAWSQHKRLVKHTYNPMGTFRDKDDILPKDRQESIDNMSYHFAKTSQISEDPSFDSNHHTLVENDATNGLYNDGETITLTSCAGLPFSLQQLSTACTQAKIHTALGPDEISPHFLRQGGATLHSALHLLFTICYGHGRIPTPLKHAKVVAIYKQSGDIDDPNNYRPISITSIVMRLWERLMKSTMLEAMERFDIPSPHQYGFTKSRSTYDAIFHLLCNVVDSFDDPSTSSPPKNNYVPTIFIDIAKAYDKVWIPGLLYKLKQLNLDPHFYHFLKAFLTGRTFQVVHSGYTSILQILQAGVPQGSILAVFLFLIYIHGITENIHPRTSIKLFADDIALHPKGAAGPSTIRYLQSSLNSITSYARKWKITFSSKKTNIIFFRPRPVSKTPQRVPSYPSKTQALTLTGFRIEPTFLYTYLGIILDQYLTMNPHQQNIIATTTKTSFMISRLIKRDRPPSFPVIKQLVSAILIPKIAYGIPFFHIQNKQTKTTKNIALRANSEARLAHKANMYRKIKNIILRPLLKALGLPFRAHHNSVFIESRLLPLEFLQAKHAAAYVYRLLNMDTTHNNEAATLMKKYVETTQEEKQQHAHRVQQQQQQQQQQRRRRRRRRQAINRNNNKNQNKVIPFKTKMTHYPDIHPFHRLLRLCSKVPGLSPTDNTFRTTTGEKHADLAWEAFYKQWYTKREGHSLPPHYTQETPERKTLPTYSLHDDPSTAAKRARLRFGRALIAFCWFHCGNKKTNPECTRCRGTADNTSTPYLPESVQHIIEQCPRYKTQRDTCSTQLQQISPSIIFNTSTILSPHDQPQLQQHLKEVLHISGAFIQQIQHIRKF